MIEIKKYPSMGINNNEGAITLASGPVIINGGKVLLVKHGDDTFWKFPGGTARDSESLRETAKREVKEELGIDISLSKDPYVISFSKTVEGKNERVILFHYLATIVLGEVNSGRDVREWAWHNIDNLPEDIASNIMQAVKFFS